MKLKALQSLQSEKLLNQSVGSQLLSLMLVSRKIGIGGILTLET
ncbi:hypothetical protein VIBNISOn1_770008 [Vibrio nigripulchritudo SOn1]|uniref:Uncharacterized protein n=1 Tax=Vibrio nigripulchritudo SOn1 TaxID=1238450 RepID=A0AAV2VW82_9VIBR|nr:hypothetical protein VIBNISOn1_770008 [Vibrio nigripulchritudo SOn1]